MIPLSSIVARFEADYLRQHHAAILPGQRQALAAMKHCRTAFAPRLLAHYGACDERRHLPVADSAAPMRIVRTRLPAPDRTRVEPPAGAPMR